MNETKKKFTNLSFPPIQPVPDKSEAAIISTMLCHPITVNFFIENIRAKDFSNKKHKIIYKAIQYLFFQGSPIDLVSIAEVLKGAGKLEECGGAVYLAELLN